MFRGVRDFAVRVARVVWTIMALLGVITTILFFLNNRVVVVQREAPVIISNTNVLSSVVGPLRSCSDLRTVDVEAGDGWLAVIERGCEVSEDQAYKYEASNSGRLYPGTTQVCCSTE